MRLVFALVPLALAACVTPAATQQVTPLYVRHAMQTQVNPAIVAIWDVTNNAADENGGLDAALMTADSWQTLATSADALATASDHMAAASDIRAAAPGNIATDEFEITMDRVQTYLDADPQGFRDLSAAFAALARNLLTAAQNRDTATAGALVAQMDTQCAACHTRYWYAEVQ